MPGTARPFRPPTGSRCICSRMRKALRFVCRLPFTETLRHLARPLDPLTSSGSMRLSSCSSWVQTGTTQRSSSLPLGITWSSRWTVFAAPSRPVCRWTSRRCEEMDGGQERRGWPLRICRLSPGESTRRPSTEAGRHAPTSPGFRCREMRQISTSPRSFAQSPEFSR